MDDIEFVKKKEKADKETRSTRTFDEAMQMDSGDMRWLARNYRELRVCVSIFCSSHSRCMVKIATSS